MSFFIFLLQFRVGLGNDRPWFAAAKPQLTEQTLTLSDTQGYPESFGQMVAEQLAVPKVLEVSEFTRGLAKVLGNTLACDRVHPVRPTRARALLQSCKPATFKSLHPKLNCPTAVPEESGHFGAIESRANQQDSMKPMVIARLSRAENLVLYGKSHNVCICNFQLAHSILPSGHSVPEGPRMRNYF